MESKSPVIEGLENYEIHVGGENCGQPEYNELKALHTPQGIFVTRWSLTQEERDRISAGEDLFLSVATFNHPFQPVRLTVGSDYGTAENAKRELKLDDDYELRVLLAQANQAAADMQKRQLAILNGDAEVTRLAQIANEAKQNLERKKAEVFTDKPGPGLVDAIQ